MAKLLKLRRGTTSQHSSFTGAEGEVTVDTDKESLVVHNGSTAGGFALARADSPDSQKTRWGDGNDLEIFHDATNSYLTNSTGYLFTQTDNYSLGAKSVGENMIIANVNDGVDLYYDNSKKLETKSFGVEINGRLAFPDIDKATWGTGDDLQIYHDSSNSRIHDGGTGVLAISGSQVHIQNAAQSETCAKFIENGAVELYEDNVLKLRTGTDGERGSVEAKAGKGSDWDGYSIGGYYAFLANNRGNADTVQIYNDLDNETMFLATRGGSAKLYYDGNEKFATGADGATVTGYLQVGVGGGTNGLLANDDVKLRLGDGQDLELYHDGTNSFIKSNTNSCVFLGGMLQINDLANSKASASFDTDGAVTLNHNDNTKFVTSSTGGTITGRLLTDSASIGTANTNEILTINSASSNNAVSIRNTTGGNGHVGILFSTQDHSGGREKAAIFHHETHGSAHYGGDIAFCLATSTGSAGQVALSDRKATITRHGGMCFGTDTADANCLDDYEEGNLSWQLRKSGSTGTGTDNGSNVKYTKVGRMVHITGRIRTDSTPGDGNEFFYLSGTLPFTPSTSGTAVIGHIRSQDQENSSLTASVSWVGSSTTVYLYTIDNDGDYAGDQNNIPANTQTNMVITFSLTYQA